HILIHPWSEPLEDISKDEFKMRENQANMFAGAFLLPKNSFIQDIMAFPTDLEYYLFLKKKWKVSVAAMLYRARTLGVLSFNQYQYLMRQYSKKGWRKHEPDDVPFLLNENIFQGAIDTLFEARYFTPATLMRFFGMRGINLYPNEIEKLLHLRAGTLKTEETHTHPVRLKLVTGDNLGGADVTSTDSRSE
ncbi:MAG TPA: ImmA/IrrE family metallo-endopeptidase, partial [Candidatus Aphodomonas merdavium]|nr:ImmA/IrrE family metallo-endopeptidase [Candidatus Aphodomonas merdavium]